MRLGERIGYISDRPVSTLLFSTSVAAAFTFLAFAVNVAMQELGVRPILHSSVQALIVGLAAGTVSVVFLVARRNRRRYVAGELARIAELNHCIRNSLQIISYAHYKCADPVHEKLVMDAISEIDLTLKRLFPSLGVERRQRMRSTDRLDQRKTGT